MIITDVQKFWLESDFVLELLKQIPASVFWKNRNSVYLGCNTAFAYSLGLSSPAEVVGKTDYDLPTTKEESDSFRADDKQVIESKKPKLNIEEYQTFHDGRKVALLTNKVPLLDKQNNVIGILGIYYDITERKQREEELREAKEKTAIAEAANRAKTEFLKNMRHDMCTPLAGITNLSQIIQNEATDSKIKGHAASLVTSSNALSSLLDSVLEAINVGSGEIPLLKKSFSLQEKLQEIILLNQAKARQKNLELLFDYDPTIPQHLIGDPTRLHRIALELITNALNFTEKGHVRLSVQLAKDNKEDAIVKIVVEDTGIGIESAKQQELYVRFKRFAPSYEGISKGFGLGLYVIKQFIDDLQGELYVESQVGVGSKFTAIIKLRKSLLDEPPGQEG
jgi:PAS domain S-box-containing protein